MQTIEVKGSVRQDVGKKATKELRSSGLIPCVVYGGAETIHFAANAIEFKDLVYSAGVYLVDLNLDGKKYGAIMQDIQYHPVEDNILHVDFLAIDAKKPIIIEIPVKLVGFAEGVKAGGKLVLEMRKLRVKGLPSNLPDSLEINIDNIAIGKTVQVKELSFENLEVLNAKNAVVVGVKLTRAAKAAQGK